MSDPPRTITETVLSEHLAGGELVAGEVVDIEVD